MQNNFTEYIFIIMKSVFEYISYRECIRDFYEEQKARKALSWASFAESAGIKSPVFLQYVCEGKKNLGANARPRRWLKPWGLPGSNPRSFASW